MAVVSWANYFKRILCLFLFAVLTACSSDTVEPEDSVVEGVNGILSAQLSNSSDSSANIITQGTSAIISVSLSDSNNAPINNQPINFTTDKGAVSADSRLTGSDGSTEITVSTSEISTGIVTVTISTTINEETLSIDVMFEVQDGNVIAEGFSLSLVLIGEDGEQTNRVTTASSAQLQATALDENNNPIADHPVSFTAEIGTLSAPSTLTNDDGIASVTLTSDATLGAGFASATAEINSISQTDSFAYEVTQGVVIDNVFLGYFDDSNAFIAEQINSSNNVDGNSTINAGATLGLEFAIVDENESLINEPLSVSFTSACVASSDAIIDEIVTSVNGLVRATYKDISCATVSGNEDTIVASLTVNSQTYTLTHGISLQPEGLGSVEFISAAPDSIVIKGTGGQGKQETATLTFLVKGELGNPIEQQEVTFSLTSDVGGIELIETSGLTNSEGLVSAIVKSGTVPTAVRVNAEITTDDGETISSQSDLLSINTGLPDQNSMTIAFSETNPEARNIVGKQVTVSAYMADSFNNPVPDGTTINFTTEGGSIEAFCHTFNGNCSVIWTSQEPYQSNHRATVLAYAIGHESFIDVNGNNIVDDNDGGIENDNITNINAVQAGFERPEQVTESGYIDLVEAWRDDNESDTFDSGEVFIDYNNNGNHDVGDGYFNGPQCQSDTLCPEEANNLLTVRKAKVLITSSSGALYSLRQNSDSSILAQNYQSTESGLDTIPNTVHPETATTGATAITRGSVASYQLQISDRSFQTLSVGTSISIATNAGELSGHTSAVIPNTVGTTDPAGYGGVFMNFNLLNSLASEDEATNATIQVSATSPSGVVTTFNIVVTLL